MPENKTTGEKAESIIFKIFDLLFPAVSELQYIMLIAASWALVTFNSDGDSFFTDFLNSDDGFPLFVAIIVVTIIVLKRRKLGRAAKYGMCLVYFGIFAILAVAAIRQQVMPGQVHSIFDFVNYWFIRVLLLVSVARAILLFILNSESTLFTKIIAHKVSDRQYRPLGFVLGAILSYAGIIIMNHYYYEEGAVVMLLGYTYASIAMSILAALLGKRIYSDST